MNNISDDASGVKPTPGPWIIEDDSEGAIWVASENPPPREQYWTTAKCYGPNAKANARLIAAAPDMLEALKEVRGCPQAAPWLVQIGAWDKLNAAIAKAEGR